MGGGGGSGWGGQGGCERRIEVFEKIHKKKSGWGGGCSGWGWGGVRVDVNEKLKFLGKFTKKIGGGGRGVQGGCEHYVGDRGRCGVWGM